MVIFFYSYLQPCPQASLRSPTCRPYVLLRSAFASSVSIESAASLWPSFPLALLLSFRLPFSVSPVLPLSVSVSVSTLNAPLEGGGGAGERFLNRPLRSSYVPTSERSAAGRGRSALVQLLGESLWSHRAQCKPLCSNQNAAARAGAAAAPASNRRANVCLRSPTYRPYVPLRSALPSSVFKNH